MSEIKLVILGEGSVGKSAMTIQFLQNHFIEIYDPTIEDSYRKKIVIDDRPYYINILDTAGQEEYTAIRDIYMRNGDGFVVVYDITNRWSFQNVYDFVYRIRCNRGSENVPILICGNKCDLNATRTVHTHEGMTLAGSLKCKFYECSAKEMIQVKELWHDVIGQVIAIKFKSNIQKKKKHHCNII